MNSPIDKPIDVLSEYFYYWRFPKDVITVSNDEVFAFFKTNMLSMDYMSFLYKKKYMVEKEVLLREEIPLFQRVLSLRKGNIKENIISFCSQYCCLFLEGVEGLFDHEEGFDLFKPNKRNGAFSARHKMDFRLGKGCLVVSLGKVEQWQSFAEGVRIVVDSREEEERYIACRGLLEEYPTTTGIDSRFQATYERSSTPASSISLSLARLLTGEEKYYKCAECGIYSKEETMSHFKNITVEEREFLQLPLVGELWFHNQSKSSRYACYNNIWYRLKRYRDSLKEGRRLGKHRKKRN